MKTTLLLFTLFTLNIYSFAIKIPHLETTIGKTLVFETDKDSVYLKAIPPYNHTARVKFSRQNINLLDETQFRWVFNLLITQLFTTGNASPNDSFETGSTAQTIRNGIRANISLYFRDYVMIYHANGQKDISSDAKKEEETDNGFSEPVRVTFGWNFNDMQRLPKGSFYGRISYFTDNLYDKNDTNSCIFGLYTGFFKQGYQVRQTTPRTYYESKYLSTVGNDSFGVNREVFIRDTVTTQLEHYGFFISPSVKLWGTENIRGRVNGVRAYPSKALWFNVDLEYSLYKFKDSYKDRKINTISYHRHNDSISNYKDYSAQPETPSQLQHQIQYGIGLTYAHSTKTIEFLVKPSFGLRELLIPRGNLNFYGMWYFCASHKPTGLRIGGELRSFKDVRVRDSYGINYTLFIAYTLSLNKLANLFPGS